MRQQRARAPLTDKLCSRYALRKTCRLGRLSQYADAVWKPILMPWLLIAIAFVLCGCSSSRLVNLYAVQGPLASQRPPPVIVGSVDGISGNTRTLTLALPSGELCSGQWSSVAAEVTSSSLFGRF